MAKQDAGFANVTLARGHAWSVAVFTLMAFAACGGTSDVICKRDPNTGFERCQESNNYGEAAVGAGAAAVVWGAKGCTVNGCEAPYRCNAETKQCVRIPCNEDKDCPAAYNCDVVENRCW